MNALTHPQFKFPEPVERRTNIILKKDEAIMLFNKATGLSNTQCTQSFELSFDESFDKAGISVELFAMWVKAYYDMKDRVKRYNKP